MAYLNRFLITFGFLLFGLFMWVILPNTIGLIAFILFGFVGALLGAIVFRKQASEKQIKEDLQNRLDND
ncbi:hypothetical protein [Maritalea mediterranea]|uniref:DUF4229 domain-containing protein n=1 Tax=Maritalea mediterranea TaxID=2909667 RepID=A0ABS9E8N6_9HYPH|nr:hypothetical protein [Maritalea mediterranea]MCF4099163.1 hypothetical protein [Maritalea mediterranea]